MSDEPIPPGLDPESAACFPLMVEVIADEITARLAVADTDPGDPAWVSRIATVAADALLDHFMVQSRTDGEFRYRRE